MVATYFRRGCGRSRNARIAENEGRMPLSRAVQEVRALTDCTVSLAKEACQITWSGEWHHVGKYANQCNYYSVRAAAAWLLTRKQSACLPADFDSCLHDLINCDSRNMRWNELEARCNQASEMFCKICGLTARELAAIYGENWEQLAELLEERGVL